MRAIILAAGEGTRLRPYTLERPKCMVELAGRPLLAHQIGALERAGVRDITVVTGYRAEQIEALGYPTAHNPRFASTNMVTSLMCAAHLLDGAADVLIAYGDLVYEPRVVEALLACTEPLCTTIDRSWRHLWELRLSDPLSDAETLKMSEEGDILELGKKPQSYDEIQGQYMGLIKVSANFATHLVTHHQRLDPKGTYDGKDLDNMYMTSFLQSLIDHGHNLRAVPVDGGWLEVDTTDDLDLYSRIQAEGHLADYCRLESVVR